jgi:hypothetical protein
MSIKLNDNIRVQAPKPLDEKYGTYDTPALALAAIDESYERYLGLTVGVVTGGVVEDYWFKSGIADVNLVLKSDSINYWIRSGNNLSYSAGTVTVGGGLIVSDISEGLAYVDSGGQLQDLTLGSGLIYSGGQLSLDSEILSQLVRKGLWDAATNTPAIPVSSASNNGWFYIVQNSVAAGHAYPNIPDVGYKAGDWLLSNGSVWEKVKNSAATNWIQNGNDVEYSGGNVLVAGLVTATSFSGIGTLLTALNATNISSGTLADARLSTNVPLKNAVNTFAAAITIDALLSLKTNTWHTSTDGHIRIYYEVNSSTYFGSPISFIFRPNGIGTDDIKIDSGGFRGNGSALTGLNAVNISTGTLSDARLSSNVALKNINNNFPAQTISSSGVQLTLNGNGASSSLIAFSNNEIIKGYLYWNTVTSSFDLEVAGVTRQRWTSALTTIFTPLTVSSTITATSFIRSGGTSAQFLKADGSIDSNIYIPSTGGTFTGNVSVPTLRVYANTVTYWQLDRNDSTGNLEFTQSGGSPFFAITSSGNINWSGTATGNGSGLTDLNATNISTGTLADDRLSTNVPLKGVANTFIGAQTIKYNSVNFILDTVSAGNTSMSFLSDGVGKVGLYWDRANDNFKVAINGGLRQSWAVSGTNITGTLGVSGVLTAGSFSGVGTLLTALNATNIITGTLAEARLSSNVPLKNVANTFAAAITATSFVGDGRTLTNTLIALVINATAHNLLSRAKARLTATYTASTTLTFSNTTLLEEFTMQLTNTNANVITFAGVTLYFKTDDLPLGVSFAANALTFPADSAVKYNIVGVRFDGSIFDCKIEIR